MSPQQRRWVCPRGCGTNVLAPGRMRRDDVRRYCLPCSAATGRLVQRECPALERQRAKRKAKRAEQQARVKEQVQADTAHLRAAERARAKAARLKVWAREGLPTMDPTWLALRDGHDTRGRAGLKGWVVVGRRQGLLWHEVVILHEFVHVCLYRLRHPKRRGHGQAFRGLFLAAAEEYFGLDTQAVLTEWEACKGTRRLLAYDLDTAVFRVIARERGVDSNGKEINT